MFSRVQLAEPASRTECAREGIFIIQRTLLSFHRHPPIQVKITHQGKYVGLNEHVMRPATGAVTEALWVNFVQGSIVRKQDVAFHD